MKKPEKFSQKNYKIYLVFLLIFLFFFSIYFFFRINNYSSDSINYAISIEEGNIYGYNFWRMEHPLWGITGRGLYLLGKDIGYNEGSLIPMQFLNALCGSLAAGFLFLIIVRILERTSISLLISSLFGFSYYFWFWSSEVKFYSIAALFVILTIYFMTGKTPLSPSGAFLTGVMTALSMLYHSANIILFVPLTITFFLQKQALKKNLFSYIMFLSALVIFFIIPHIIILVKFSGINIAGLIGKKETLPWFGVTPRLAGFDINNLSSRLQLFTNLISATLLSGGVIGGPSPNLKLNLQIISFAAFLSAVILLFIRFRRNIPEEQKPMALFCLSWIPLQITAMLIVDPYNYYIYIVLVPCLILLSVSLRQLLISYHALNIPLTALILIAVLMLSFLNYFAGIKPFRGENETMNRVQQYRHYISPADTMVFPGLSNDHEYARYYLKCTAINIFEFFLNSPYESTDNVLEQIKSTIDIHLATGARVFLDGDLLEGNFPKPQNAPPNMNIELIKNFFKSNYYLKLYFDYKGRKILRLENINKSKNGR